MMNLFRICLLVSLAFFSTVVRDNPSANAAGDTTYIVKKGDTLWSIARTLWGDGARWHELLQKNPSFRNPHMIFPGESITIESITLSQETRKETELPSSDTATQISEMVDAIVSNEVRNMSPEEQNQGAQTQVPDDDIALDFLISSLVNDLKSALSQSDSASISRIGTSSRHSLLPVYSLLFVSSSNVPAKDKYFVGDSDAFIISRGKLVPVDQRPQTSEMCDKVRRIAGIIENKGKYLYFEESIEDYVSHVKIMIVQDNEHFYYFILTNVNELSPTLFLNKEPVDILRIRIFSKKGFIYFTDKGLQGFPGYFFAADEFGSPIPVDPNDPIIIEKFTKALDFFLAKIAEKEKQKTDPRLKEKLNQIF